ncbi:MAG TPA: TolC family protein [Phycisphaerae bacterium]|nr:TolC family protein [Phycisphaerae bacterium]
MMLRLIGGTPKQVFNLRMAAGLCTLCALAVAGCESPLSDDDQKNWDMFAQSVLAHQIADGEINSIQPSSASVDQGVHELTGADGAAVGAQAVVPAGETSVTAYQAEETDQELGAHAAALDQPEPIVTLSLQDTIALALAHSLAIKVQAYNPAINEAQVVQAEAAFDPDFFGSTAVEQTDTPEIYNNNHVAGVPQTKQFTWDNQLGVNQNLPWGGSAEFTAGNLFTNQTQSPGFQPEINPSNAAALGVTITQPLLQGFGSDVVRANIYIAQVNQNISLAEFRDQVQTIVENVEMDYYQLIEAKVELDIQQQLLEITQETLTQIKKRGMFDATSVQVAQAQNALDLSRASVVSAQAALRTASDTLKATINDPELDLRGNMLLLPSDKAITEPIMFNIAAEIATALTQRAVMQEDRYKLHAADINVTVAANQLLPQANLTLSSDSNGLDTNFGNAFNQTISPAQYIDWGVGLNFSIPIGNRAAEADLREQKLTREQDLTQMLLDAQDVILSVKTELRALLSNYQQMQAQTQARESADQVLKALIAEERIGVSLTPEFLNLILSAEQNLASAQTAEVQAMVSYSDAIVGLQAAKGTLLEFDRIKVNQAPPEDIDTSATTRFLGTSYGEQ